MSSNSVQKDSINQLPVYILKRNDEYMPLNKEETIVMTLVIAEENRKKPGFLRRTGERITLVSPVNYLIKVAMIDEESSLLIDPNRKEKLTITVYRPDFELLSKEIDKLSNREERSFIDQLILIDKILEAMLKKKENTMKLDYDFPYVVTDKVLIEEIKILLYNILNEQIEGLVLRGEEVNVNEIIKRFNEAIYTISDSIKKLYELINKLNTHVEKWREEIRTTYAEKIHEIEQKLEVVKKEVEAKILELKQKQANETENIKKVYNERISTITKRIKKIQEQINKLESDLQKAKEYGQDISPIKSRLNELNKKLSSLLKERERLEKKMMDEIKDVRKKYNELILNEQKKIEKLKKEIDKLNNELEMIEKQATDYLDSILSRINNLTEELDNTRKKLLSFTIPKPPHGAGDHAVTAFIIQFRSRNKTREQLLTPIYYTYGRLMKTPRQNVFSQLEKYLSSLKLLANDARYIDDLRRNNALTSLSLEQLTRIVERLIEYKLVEEKKAKKIVKSLAEQARMVGSS